jgi:hypothetical protein
VYDEVLAFLLKKGVAGATVIKPEAGFGTHHRLHQKQWSGANHQHLPVRIEFIESVDVVNGLLPALSEIVRDGLIDAHETTVLKVGRQESSY